MFLLVSVRHVGAHPDEQQHDVSMINLGKTFFTDISYTKYSFDLNLGEGLCICTSFHFPDSGLSLLNGFDLYFDLIWMAWHWKRAIRKKNVKIFKLYQNCRNDVQFNTSLRKKEKRKSIFFSFFVLLTNKYKKTKIENLLPFFVYLQKIPRNDKQKSTSVFRFICKKIAKIDFPLAIWIN